jgi:hypothetical protein
LKRNPTQYQNVPPAFDPENHLTQIGVTGSPTFTVGCNRDGLRAWKQNNTTGRTPRESELPIASGHSPRAVRGEGWPKAGVRRRHFPHHAWNTSKRPCVR